MFDLTGEAYWMGPKPKKGKRREEPLFGDMGASNYGDSFGGDFNYQQTARVPRSSKRYKATRSRRPAGVRKPYTFKDVKKVAKGTYQGAKTTYQYAKRGYAGSAEKEYKKREARFKKAEREKEYKKKLKEEYGVKSGKEKIRGLFQRKKKSIYK